MLSSLRPFRPRLQVAVVLVLFGIVPGLGLARVPTASSAISGLTRDYRALLGLFKAADGLRLEMDALCQAVHGSERLSINQEDQVSHWLFATSNLRRELERIGQRWHLAAMREDLSPRQREKVLLVAFAALSEWFATSCRVYRGPWRVRHLRRKLEEPHRELGLPAGGATLLVQPLGRAGLRADLDAACAEVLASAPAGMTEVLELLKRIADNRALIAAAAPTTAWQIRTGLWWRERYAKAKSRLYRAETALYTWIGDHKYRQRLPSITHALIRNQFKPRLQPGDILLERERFFFSNLFLPGFWPHAILYVGTTEELRQLGLDRDPRVARWLKTFALPDEEGNERRVLEAISDGVVMSSLEEATDADHIACLRPVMTPEERREFIARAFFYIGCPYDFHFDFTTADKLVCSELIWRAGSEFMTLNLKKIAGRWAMATDTLVQKYTAERPRPDRELDFVFFYETDAKTGVGAFKDAQALIASLRR